MPSRIDEADHTKAFDYPSRGALGGKPKCSVPQVGLEPTTHRSGSNALPTEPHRFSQCVLFNVLDEGNAE